MPWVADTNLVGFGEEAWGQHRVFWGLQAVGGALWHDNVHGYITHCVEFLYREDTNLWSAGVVLGTAVRAVNEYVLSIYYIFSVVEDVTCTSLVLGSVGACASFVCLIFSTIFLMKAWLLFSFLAMIISRTNHRALTRRGSLTSAYRTEF